MFKASLAQRVVRRRSLLAIIAAAAVAGACHSSADEDASDGAAASTAGGWDAEIASRRDAIEQVIHANRQAFDAFESGSVGDATLEMIPFVVFRALQELEPTAFSDAALESSGFFAQQDVPSRRHGVTWTKPVAATADGSLTIRYLTRSCGSCHTGRVRLADGTVRVLHGSPNPEMNVHRFVGRVTSVLKQDLGASNDAPEYVAFRARIVDALERTPAELYWGADSKEVTVQAATAEVAAITANIDAVLGLMRTMNDKRLGGIGLLQQHSYAAATNPPSLVDGAPGVVETSGLGSASLVPLVGVENASMVLPPGPAQADIPAVWNLNPVGYANWDATLKGFARSMTSSMAIVGNPAKIDVPKNALIQDFIGKLPSEPYPFALDSEARERGEATFESNCSGCHVRGASAKATRTRDAVIFDVGTDPLRANAISAKAAVLMRKVVASACPSTQKECTQDPETVLDPSGKRGYVASALDGVWAQAPYLHNGSVPTLRHLLVPTLRTSSPFLRGSISYDTKNGGWEWEASKEAELRKRGEAAIALHDPNKAGLGNVGHGSGDRFVVDGRGDKVQIAWSESGADKAVVDDLVAYLLSL